jgi:murein DD-endopeptidase MepM/ murein hydrolase activator NlpD
VPFGCGRAFPVSQGHRMGSHLQNDSWAWDFRMPEGVPIVAALEGIVRVARGDSTIGGCDPRFAAESNYVVISHENGWETQYLHFSKVVVVAGQRVKAGDLIGYSGKTGWACGSHLHFKVARSEGQGWNNPSVPARILGYGDPVVDTLVQASACIDRAPLMASQPSAPSGAGGASIAHGASDAPKNSSVKESTPHQSIPERAATPVAPPVSTDPKLAGKTPKDKA